VLHDEQISTFKYPGCNVNLSNNFNDFNAKLRNYQYATQLEEHFMEGQEQTLLKFHRVMAITTLLHRKTIS